MRAGAGGAVALIDGASGARITYAELAEQVGAAAERLRADAGPGGIAFLFAGNDVTTVVELLGALMAGVPVALIDRRLDGALVDGLIERYRPEVVRGAARAGTPDGPPVHPDLALLLSTSGSTGSPKLVRLTRAAVEANARAIAATLELRPGDVAPTSLPIHYSFGLSVVTSHLAAGATVLLTDAGLVTDEFWRLCREHGATSLAGVPYSFQMLRRLDLGKVAPPSLRTLTQAGGRLEPALVRHFHDVARARDGRLFVMYGQTEATARIAVLPPGELPARAGAVGRALPGGELRIVRDGLAVAAGEVGEVIYRGPNVMMGYAEGRAELARGDDLGGELATGDLGYLDGDGFLWITGRSKRIAKVFGLRVSLDELEAMARAQPDAPAVAAIAGADRVTIFLEGADEAAAAACRQALSARTGIHPSGFVVTPIAVLPRLPSGKLDYRALEGA